MGLESGRRTLGAAVGLAIGWVGYHLLSTQGYYLMALPGVGLGIGAGILASHRIFFCGLLTMIAALAVSILVQWLYVPFQKDGSLVYFVTHLDKLRTMQLLSLPVVAVVALWYGMGRRTQPHKELEI